MKVVAIKGLCREANVAKIDVGPKGAVVSFRNDEFPNPAGLVGFIGKNGVAWRLRPDHKVVVKGEWETPLQRLSAAEKVLAELGAACGLMPGSPPRVWPWPWPSRGPRPPVRPRTWPTPAASWR